MLIHSNAILASLSEGDAAALRPHLQATHLQQKTVLFEAGDNINAIYFPITAVVSLVVGLATGEMTEAAMVGKDGAVGIASALDGKVSLSRAIVQLGGECHGLRSGCIPECGAAIREADFEDHAAR